MKNLLFKKNNRGIILIEALLALGVIIIIMTALVTALITSVSSSNFSKEQSEASGYAQEGLEIARNEKDADFDMLRAITGYHCLNASVSSIDNTLPTTDASGIGCTKIENLYIRTIFISDNGSDKCTSPNSVYVSSAVSWADSRCSGNSNCHKVELNSCFVNLNNL